MSAGKTLAQRRAELVARSALQRADLAIQTKALRESMAFGSVASNLLTTVKQNKLLISGAVLAVVFIKPRRILSGMRAGLIAWQAWRNVVPALQNMWAMRKQP